MILELAPLLLTIALCFSSLLSAVAITGTMPGAKLSSKVWEWFTSTWIIFGYLISLFLSVWLVATLFDLAVSTLRGWA